MLIWSPLYIYVEGYKGLCWKRKQHGTFRRTIKKVWNGKLKAWETASTYIQYQPLHIYTPTPYIQYQIPNNSYTSTHSIYTHNKNNKEQQTTNNTNNIKYLLFQNYQCNSLFKSSSYEPERPSASHNKLISLVACKNLKWKRD